MGVKALGANLELGLFRGFFCVLRHLRLHMDLAMTLGTQSDRGREAGIPTARWGTNSA